MSVFALVLSLSVHASEPDCRLSLGATEDDGVVPMRAECRWTDVDVEALDALLSSPWESGKVWAQVEDTRVVSRGREGVRIWMQHALVGMPDREVMVDWRRSVDGNVVMNRWATAPVDWDVAVGHTRCRRYEGVWEMEVLGDGSVRVAHENRYDPGPFPSWLIRPFLAKSLEDLVASLHSYVRR